MIRYVLFFFSILLVSSALAQEDTLKVVPPKIITKLKPGQTFNLPEMSVKFIKVIEDSRCPKGVSCVWEGQAKVLVAFYEGKKMMEEKEIIIGAKGINPSTPKVLAEKGEHKILGYNLSPYPEVNQKIATSDYHLQLLIN